MFQLLYAQCNRKISSQPIHPNGLSGPYSLNFYPPAGLTDSSDVICAKFTRTSTFSTK